LSVAGEHGLFRPDDMDAGVFHAVEELDCLGQFTLQGAIVIEFLDQRADAEFFIVEYFISRFAVFGAEALFGQHGADFIDLFRGDIKA